MAGFLNTQQYVDAELNGQYTFFTWRKASTQATTQGVWYDLSMSPGNPVPNYYAAAPLNSIVLSQSTDGGLFHGGAVSPQKRYLKTFGAMANAATALPMPIMILDYLMYYPFFDDSGAGPQLTNVGVASPASLTRYTSGGGVQIMAVSVAARTGGQTFSVSYTNSLGVSGRTTSTFVENVSTFTGAILTSQVALNTVGPFLTLQAGDTGVRSIESVTMNGPDVGLFTLVLVKPIATTSIRGIDAFCEKNYLMDECGLPEIKDDAYLNMICLPMGVLNATALNGYIQTIWN